MRHPFRRPLTVISLILLAACVVFWHRGNRQRESIAVVWNDGQSSAEVSVVRGSVFITVRRAPVRFINFYDSETGELHEPLSWQAMGPLQLSSYDVRCSEVDIVSDESIAGGGFHIWETFLLWTGRGFAIVRVPILAICLFLLVFPTTAAGELLRARRRSSRGLCAECGYDLRHSKDRCPECGTPISPPEENPPKTEAALPSSS